MEMADLIAITKTDGDNVKKAQQACTEYQHALHLIRPNDKGWEPKVITCSAVEEYGLDTCWDLISKFITHSKESGTFDSTRGEQKILWLNNQLNAELRKQFTHQDVFDKKWKEAEDRIKKNEWTVFDGVRYLIS